MDIVSLSLFALGVLLFPLWLVTLASGTEIDLRLTLRPAPRGPAAAQPAPPPPASRAAPDVAPASAHHGPRHGPRAAYAAQDLRIQAQLNRARLALARITAEGTPQSALVAGHTARRLDSGDTTPVAALAFARHRLSVLAHGTDPAARHHARLALGWADPAP